MKVSTINHKKLALYFTGCLFLSLLYTNNAAAQDTEHWFVAPDASNLHEGCDRPTFIMITTGSESANVTISIPKNSGFADETKSLGPNSYWKYTFGPSETYDVDVVENAYTNAGSVTDKGIHIKSDSGPISVYYQVDGSCSKDIFTLKGKKALGSEFYTPFQSKYSRTFNDAYAQIHLVATEDNTTIDITPPTAIVGGAANTVKTITLNRGDSYLIREATYQSKTNLAGTHIKTRDDKKIAVIVADDCLANANSIDITGDQIVPIDNLGTNYVVIKGFTSGGATDNVYVLAAHDGTQVFLNGSGIAVTTLNKGQTYHNDMGASGVSPDALYVRTSKPAYCYQQSAIGNEMGAAALPSMYSISAKKVTFFKQALVQNQVFLIFRKGKAGGFKINGNTMPVTANNITGLDDWQYARVDIKSLTTDNAPCSIENPESIFALGYFTGGTTGTALYGFLSNFGQLEFPEKTYKCIDQSVTLDAGYAQGYMWWKGHESDEPADGSPLILSTSNSYTVPVGETGFYCVKVNQDPFIITTKTEVINDKFGATTTAPKYAKKGNVYNFSASVWRDIAKSYTWTINGTTPSSATAKDVSNISWATTGKYNVNLKIDNTDLGCDTTMTQEVLVYDIQDDYTSVSKNRSVTVDVLVNDDFSAFTVYPYTVEIVSNGTYGTATVVSNKIVYNQTAGYTTNTDQVVYRVRYNGDIIDQATVYIKTNSLLVVIKESGDDPSEPSTPGKFTIKYRDTGFAFDKALKIHYKLEGTAECDVDYIKPTDYNCGTGTGFVTMPANGLSIPLNITPKDNYRVEGNSRTVEVTITSVEVVP